MAALGGVIETAGWLAFPTGSVAWAEPTSPAASVAVALIVAVPAAPKAYDAFSESAGFEGLVSESIRTHVLPLSMETSIATDASGLPPGAAEADAGARTVTSGGGAGARPTGPPPPAFRASVEIALTGFLATELWLNQNRNV